MWNSRSAELILAVGLTFVAIHPGIVVAWLTDLERGTLRVCDAADSPGGLFHGIHQGPAAQRYKTDDGFVRVDNCERNDGKGDDRGGSGFRAISGRDPGQGYPVDEEHRV